MLLDFIMTAESNSLSKRRRKNKLIKKFQTQPPSVKLGGDTMKMQNSILFHFHVSPFVSCRMLLWFFFLTSPHLAQVFVFAVLSRLTRGSLSSGCFYYLSEKKIIQSLHIQALCSNRELTFPGNRATTNKTKLWMPFLFTMGLTELYSEGTNCNDAFWKPDPFN